MRIKIGRTKNQGSVLLVTLCTAWVIGIALVSYLNLVANQNRTTYHSQSWSGCIPVLEAGIEEALTQLNYDNGEGTNNATAHGWTLLSNGFYYKSQIVGPTTDGAYYEVAIDPNTNGTPATPIIISQGYVPAPGNTGAPLGGETAYGTILATVSGQSTPAMISRTVQVGTRLQASQGPPGGLIAKGQISMGLNAMIDSFDSSNPLKSGLGGLYDATKRQANAKALTNRSAPGAISVGSGQIYGSATTGAAGTVTYTSGSGSVGDLDWHQNNNTGIQLGADPKDANVQFDDVAAPFLFGSGSTPIFNAPAQPPVGGTNYNWVLDAAVNSKFNYSGTIIINASQRMVVTGGDVTLYVNGNFGINGGVVPGYVYVAPGASLKLYVNGIFSNAGNGVVNGTGLAKNFGAYGLSKTLPQTWPLSGNSAFIGTVYAPYATINFSGSAGASGSFSANSVLMSGNTKFHYDESLSVGGSTEYIAISWNEI